MVFTQIPTGVVILVRKGLYRQCEAYHRSNELYAKAYGGFVRLLGGRTTSIDNTYCDDINLPNGFKFGGFGKLTLPNDHTS